MEVGIFSITGIIPDRKDINVSVKKINKGMITIKPSNRKGVTFVSFNLALQYGHFMVNGDEKSSKSSNVMAV